MITEQELYAKVARLDHIVECIIDMYDIGTLPQLRMPFQNAHYIPFKDGVHLEIDHGEASIFCNTNPDGTFDLEYDERT